jgi:hypothetical protein
MFRRRRSEWDTENGNEIPQQYVELETLGHAVLALSEFPTIEISAQAEASYGN